MEAEGDVPMNAPTSCPGVASASAGRSAACSGCPNQSLCSSGTAQLSLEEREPDTIREIRRRLRGVRHCLFVLSGKGGVGKSSVSVCLARGLCQKRNDTQNNLRVGIMDMDLCGPSLPCLLGCLDGQVHECADGWSPVFVTESLSVMSVGFLNPTYEGVVWRGPQKNAFIRQLLSRVLWTDEEQDSVSDHLDVLIIDTPPGTSDEHLSTVAYIKAAGCACSAIVVTTPQEVALSDVRKELNFCKKVGLHILGVVENMSAFECPRCGVASVLFPATTGGAAALCGSLDGGDGLSTEETQASIALLASLPLDTRLTRCLDEGRCPFEEARTSDGNLNRDHNCELKCSNALNPELPVMRALSSLVDTVHLKLQQFNSAFSN